MTITIPVDLAGRSYEIVIGRSLLNEAGATIASTIGKRRLVVITDENVAAHHLATLESSLTAVGFKYDIIIVPAGEASKDLHRFPALLERILALGIDRRSVVVAFGGGVVGDLAGFAAASLLRGLDFVQIPTTLLAQIDSSVGGKTGLNAHAGKNLVGAFHQPRLVLADLGLLETLPRRELLAGYAEMLKYGLLGDAGFFEELERHTGALLSLDLPLLAEAVAKCCRMKAAIVAEDEREAGRRALLNLGHTFGHALEAETGFGGALLHGEGVAIGMALAADLSVELGRITIGEADRIRRHLTAMGLPADVSGVQLAPGSVPRLIGHMMHDKKMMDNRLTFIVLDRIGQASVLHDVVPAAVERVLAAAGAR